jgi:dienelactone hydrolase
METHDEKTLAFLNHLYTKDAQAFGFRGSAPDDVASWSGAARPALRELLGLRRMRDELDGFEPSVSIEDAEDLGDHTRQKGILHAEPGFDVPFWYLKPKGAGPHPLALFPHGHYAKDGLDYAAGVASSPEMLERIQREDRDVAAQAVRRGFAAIAPATRGFQPACIPDITNRHGKSNCRSQLVHALLAGRTAVGERLWDLERLIDWAAGQSDIDTSTVLMMGNSGGGVTTLYAAACDERVTIAVASCSFCTFVGADGTIHHCDCHAVPGILRFGEFSDVAGLVAPRHLLTVNGRTDSLFPLDEVDRAVTGVQRIYAAANAPDAYRHTYAPEGHRFYSDLMWPFVTEALDSPGSPG